MNLRKPFVFLSKTLLLFVIACAAGQAQTPYPSKPVRIVVGLAPGGATDIIGRLIGQKLNESTGQPFLIDNRPGAATTIAAEYVAKAAPDGYTLMIGIPTSHSVLPSLIKLNYDPARDFAPIAMLVKVPMMLAVHPSLPVHSIADLIKLAKVQPGQLTYGTGGIGSPLHMAAELLSQMAGLKLVHIPYKGEAPAIAELRGGQISMIFGSIVALLPHVRAEKLRGIALTGKERVPTLREFPTVSESGLPGFEVEVWYGLLAPTGTSNEIITRLNRELVRALSLPEVRERLTTQGLFVSTSTPEGLGGFMKAEIAKWAKVIKDNGIKPE